MNRSCPAQQLPSKKNKVIRMGNTVVKTISDPNRFRTEKEIGDLLLNSGLPILERLAVDETNHRLLYRYVAGVPAVDLLDSIGLEQAKDLIRKICAWLLEFYRILNRDKGNQFILGDIHLRNFLYDEDTQRLYGLDFEECRPGRIESDTARLLVFILHYEPAFTQRKKELAACFRETMEAALTLDQAFLEQEIERETAELEIRRAFKHRGHPLGQEVPEGKKDACE